MVWLSPTGTLTIRNDAKGKGHFGAKRGPRQHNGIDLEVSPGQTIQSPVDGTFLRISNPYADDNRWHGVCMWCDAMYLEVYIWYIKPYWFRKGQLIARSEVIGVAQDIVEKYGIPMNPHIHLGVKRDGEWIDPMPLFL